MVMFMIPAPFGLSGAATAAAARRLSEPPQRSFDNA